MSRLFLAICASLLVTLPASARDGEGFSGGQKREIEKIIQDYLMENPQAVVEILERARDYHGKRAAAAREELEAVSPAAFQMGEGDLTVVVFFDYRCPYCREGYPDLMGAVRQDGGARLVAREFPVFGELSLFAARMAAASARQGKYWEMHDALMRWEGSFTESAMWEAAKARGLDVKRLRRDMRRGALRAAIERNLEMGREWKVLGTPTLFLGGRLVRGIPKKERLLEMFAEARRGAR